MSGLFKRQTLDQLCDVPEDIIDVYVVERHIWQGGTVDSEAESKKKRRAEPRTAKDFLIDPVRSLLNDVLRQLAAPYDPAAKRTPSAKVGGFKPSSAPVSRTCSRLSVPWPATRRVGDRQLLGDQEQKGKRESDLPVLRHRPRQEVHRQVEGHTRRREDTCRSGRRDHRRHGHRPEAHRILLDAVQDQYHAENGKPSPSIRSKYWRIVSSPSWTFTTSHWASSSKTPSSSTRKSKKT